MDSGSNDLPIIINVYARAIYFFTEFYIISLCISIEFIVTTKLCTSFDLATRSINIRCGCATSTSIFSILRTCVTLFRPFHFSITTYRNSGCTRSVSILTLCIAGGTRIGAHWTRIIINNSTPRRITFFPNIDSPISTLTTKWTNN